MIDFVRKNKRYEIRILFTALLLFASILFTTACQSSDKNTSLQNTGEIEDCIGRTVLIPREIDRIAALDSFAGETVIMLGAGEKMVATPNGVQRDKLLLEIYPPLADVAVPMSEGSVNAESLLTLSPDVILLKEALYLDQGEREKLEKLSIPYLVVSYNTMEDQIYALDMIGQALGGKAKTNADGINAYYRKIIQLTAERTERIPPSERFRVYHAINEAVRTDGEASLGADWTENVGLINVSVGEKLTSEGTNYYCNMEQIFKWNPDIILCNDATTMKYLLSDEKWTGLRAVYDDQVYNIPIGATRWGQQGSLETFFAMLWAGTTLYPEYYSDINLKEEVTAFYKQFLGLSLDDETYAMILAGEGIRVSGQNSGK